MKAASFPMAHRPDVGAMHDAPADRAGHPALPSAEARQWELRRNCSLTPRQCLASLAVLSAITCLIALILWVAGFPFVAFFAAAETAGMAVALVQYARHARDGDTLTLHAGRLEVRQRCAHQLRVERFDACWVTVAPPRTPGDLIVLRQHGREVRVGSHARPVLRRAIEHELRAALRSA